LSSLRRPHSHVISALPTPDALAQFVMLDHLSSFDSVTTVGVRTLIILPPDADPVEWLAGSSRSPLLVLCGLGRSAVGPDPQRLLNKTVPIRLLTSSDCSRRRRGPAQYRRSSTECDSDSPCVSRSSAREEGRRQQAHRNACPRGLSPEAHTKVTCETACDRRSIWTSRAEQR